MKFMATVRPQPDRQEVLRELLPAEIPHVEKLRLAGRIHEVYASSVSRAWVVLRAESTEEAERVLAELPFSHHVYFEVE